MKNLKLKPLVLPDQTQILIKPPDFLATSHDSDRKVWTNCTFSTIEELKDLIKSKRANRQSTVAKKHEDRDQVEKLNNWRLNSAGQSPRILPKYTFRHRLSVTYDPSTIQPVSTLDFNKEQELKKSPCSIIGDERNKNKLMKDEFSRVTEKNNNIIGSALNELRTLEKDAEKVAKLVRTVKNEIFEMQKEMSGKEAAHNSEISRLIQQETSILLVGRNVQLKKLFKLGEVHEHYLLKEKIRQQRQALIVEFTDFKEKLTGELASKHKEKEGLTTHKNELKKEHNYVKSSLAAVYLRILKAGLDIREEGIRWVLKALWELDEPIPLSSFPAYLDEESSQFLLAMAKLDLELAEYQARLLSTRKKMKSERNLSQVPITTGNILTTVRDRLRILSSSVIAEPIKKINEATVTEASAFNDTKSYANELTWIKENIERLNKVMNNLSEQELRRVSNCYKNSPKSVTLPYIFKALLGLKARDYIKLTQI